MVLTLSTAMFDFDEIGPANMSWLLEHGDGQCGLLNIWIFAAFARLLFP